MRPAYSSRKKYGGLLGSDVWLADGEGPSRDMADDKAGDRWPSESVWANGVPKAVGDGEFCPLPLAWPLLFLFA